MNVVNIKSLSDKVNINELITILKLRNRVNKYDWNILGIED